MARQRDSYQSMFFNALDQVGQAGKTIAANRQTAVENEMNAKRIGLAESQNQREADKFAIEKPGMELEQNRKKADYQKLVEKDMIEGALKKSQGELSKVREIPIGVRNDVTEGDLSQRVADQFDQLNDRPVGTTWRAQQGAQTKDKQTAEAHASQLETDKVKREQGNFSPFVLNGNVLGAFDTRRGKVVNTGEQAQPKPGPVGNAKDVVVAGETLIPNMEPIPGVEITKDSVKKTKDAFSTYQSFKNQLTKYTDLVNKQGAELVGEKADEADALVTDLGLKLKELQELGVLTGNDWQLMMKQIPSSTSMGGNAKSAIYSMVGKDAFGPRLQVLNTSVDDKFKNFAETNGFRKAMKQGGASGSFDAPPSGSSKFKILSVE